MKWGFGEVLFKNAQASTLSLFGVMQNQGGRLLSPARHKKTRATELVNATDGERRGRPALHAMHGGVEKQKSYSNLPLKAHGQRATFSFPFHIFDLKLK